MMLRRFLSIALMMLIPLLQLQAEVAGVLRLKGTVWTNGSPARDGSVVSAGDKVQTGKGGFANMSNRAGDSVVVTEDSTAIYKKSGVRLESGAAVLLGRNMTAEIGGLKVSGSAVRSQYLLHADDSKVEIAAVKGSVTVQDGNEAIVLPEGKVMTKQRTASNAPAPAAAVSNFSGSAALITILSAAAAAGIATGIAVFQGDDKPVSPSAP